MPMAFSAASNGEFLPCLGLNPKIRKKNLIRMRPTRCRGKMLEVPMKMRLKNKSLHPSVAPD